MRSRVRTRCERAWTSFAIRLSSRGTKTRRGLHFLNISTPRPHAHVFRACLFTRMHVFSACLLFSCLLASFCLVAMPRKFLRNFHPFTNRQNETDASERIQSNNGEAACSAVNYDVMPLINNVRSREQHLDSWTPVLVWDSISKINILSIKRETFMACVQSATSTSDVGHSVSHALCVCEAILCQAGRKLEKTFVEQCTTVRKKSG